MLISGAASARRWWISVTARVFRRIAWAAAAIVLGCGTALATPSGRDLAAINSAALEWLQATTMSTPFVLGVLAGLVLAQAGRVAWRTSIQAAHGVAALARFAQSYAWLAVLIAIGLYYYIIYHTLV